MQINIIQIAVFAGLAILCFLYRSLSHRKNSPLPRIPIGFIVIYLILKISAPIFQAERLSNIAYPLEVAAGLSIWLAGIRIAVYIVIDYLLRHKRGVAIPTITRDFALAILYVAASLIVIKQETDVNIGSLLTTSAILTAVIGFAMQDTLGNLFSGLALQLEQPYQIGDWISFEGNIGRVEGITWKSTKILTRGNEMVFVPNNKIAKSLITNYSKPTTTHASYFEVGASYTDAPHKIRNAILSILHDHPKVLQNPEPDVRVVKYDNFTINYRAIFYTDDFSAEEKTKCELLNAVWYSFKRNAIKIPYPVQEEVQVIPSDIENIARKERLFEEGNITSLLSSIDIFSCIPKDTLNELSKNIAALQYSRGESIVRMGEEAGPMYIIKKGVCGVFDSHDFSETSEVATLHAGQFFGEMSVLTGAPRTATVRAKTDVTCYEIEKRDLYKIFGSHPDVLVKISHVLSERKMGLLQHKNKIEEDSTKPDDSNQILSKIRSFFGL